MFNTECPPPHVGGYDAEGGLGGCFGSEKRVASGFARFRSVSLGFFTEAGRKCQCGAVRHRSLPSGRHKLRLFLINPFVQIGRAGGGEGVQQPGGVGVGEDEVAVRLADEVFGDGAVEESQEGVVEALDVQQAVGLAAKTELRPGEDFGEFLEGAEAAGQSDEGVREFGHEGLAFMNGGDDAEVLEAKVRDFFICEAFWNNADDFAAAGKHGTGNDAHQADAATAVNEADLAPGEEGAQFPGGVAVGGAGTAVGTAIDAKTFDGHAIESGIWGVGRSILQSRAGRPDFSTMNLNLPENERQWGQVGFWNFMQDVPILLAEDSDDDVFLMERAYKKAKLTNPLKIVSDGEQALAYLRGEGVYADRDQYPFPGLLLLDIKMPRMNGLEVLSAIRQDPQLRRLVVIVLTASNLDQDVNRAFDLQTNSYLVKPSDTDGMVATLDKVKDYWLRINQYPLCPAQAA